MIGRAWDASSDPGEVLYVGGGSSNSAELKSDRRSGCFALLPRSSAAVSSCSISDVNCRLAFGGSELVVGVLLNPDIRTEPGIGVSF